MELVSFTDGSWANHPFPISGWYSLQGILVLPSVVCTYYYSQPSVVGVRLFMKWVNMSEQRYRIEEQLIFVNNYINSKSLRVRIILKPIFENLDMSYSDSGNSCEYKSIRTRALKSGSVRVLNHYNCTLFITCYYLRTLLLLYQVS